MINTEGTQRGVLKFVTWMLILIFLGIIAYHWNALIAAPTIEMCRKIVD
jgi:hypothetical protein